MKPGDVVVSISSGRARFFVGRENGKAVLQDDWSKIRVPVNPITGLPTGYALKGEEKGR